MPGPPPPGRSSPWRRRAGPGARRLVPLLLALLAGAAAADVEAHPAAPAQRVVSMNPSLTEILLALGAASQLVGVDELSARQQPQLARLPRVGGLFNPSLEAVVALRPDLVTMVPSAQQRGFRERLEALGIEVQALPNLSLDEVLHSIEVLGTRVGRAQAAARRVAAVRRAFAARSAAPRPARPRAVLVIQREPLFVAGGGVFLDDMLRAVGLENAAAGFGEPYPRLSLEWLLASGPEVLLDASEDAERAQDYWARWPSLPAVATDRVVAVDARLVTLPGPYLDRALHTLADALARVDATAAPEPPVPPPTVGGAGR